MNRREALRAASAGSVALLAGCLDAGESGLLPAENGSTGATTTADRQNPWGKDTVVVAYEQEVPARRGFADVVREALDYWERNSETYTGHTIAYRLRPNADDPDILVRLVAEIRDCGELDHDEVAGCAPLVTDRAPDPTEIEVVDGYDDDPTVDTLVHELGHTLGLGHDDEPQEYMSNDIADRVPQYEAKMDVLDRYRDGITVGNEATEDWNAGVDRWNAEEYGRAASRFEDAAGTYEEARAHFEDARTTAAEIDASEARDICAEAVAHRELEIEASRLMRDAAAHADQGDYEKADAYWEDADEVHDEQSDSTIRDGEVLAEALGLPTKTY